MLKTNKSSDNLHDSKKLMKMKELAEATGVNSATIRYYVNQGLLPKPYKTHKNMAYYDDHYINLINLIKTLQNEYFLPLGIIKEKIEEVGHKKAPYMLQQIIDRLVEEKHIPQTSTIKGGNPQKALTKEEMLELTRMSREEFDLALETGFIMTNEQGLFEPEYIEIAMILSEIRSHLSSDKGFSVEFFMMHLQTLENLANKEISMFLKNMEQGEMSAGEINSFIYKSFTLFNKLAPVIHKRLINKKIKDSLSF